MVFLEKPTSTTIIVVDVGFSRKTIFRLSLPGHGRTSVGSIGLSSGVTIKFMKWLKMHIHSLQQKTLKKDFLSLAKVMPFQSGILLNNSFRKCEKQCLNLYNWFKISR